MDRIRQAIDPAARVLTALRRPETYAGHARELTSGVVTAAVWPFGFRDGGVQALGDDTATGRTETPVLLVHGYGANKSNWLFLTRYLDQAGFTRVHALNYNPFRADIPDLAQSCVARARELMDHLGVDRVHLVGHSLGGVIARYAVQVLGLEEAGVVCTVASPHGGVRIARYGSYLSEVSPLSSGLALRPDSPTMTLLRTSARPMSTRWVAYYSNLDLIVPARRAMIVEPELAATNVLVKDHGHLSIMLSRRLAHSIVDQLAAAEGLPGHGAPLEPLRGPTTASEGDPAPDLGWALP